MQAADVLCVRAKDAVTSSDPKQMAESLTGFKAKGRETKTLSYQIQKDALGLFHESLKTILWGQGDQSIFYREQKICGKRKPKTTTLVHMEIHPSPPHFCWKSLA